MTKSQDTKPVKASVKDKRFSMRMYSEDFQALTYWSEALDVEKGDLLVEALHHYIKWQNQDYDLPTAEIQRLNQLTDVVVNLTTRQESLERTVANGLDTVLGLMRGDNYLATDVQNIERSLGSEPIKKSK